MSEKKYLTKQDFLSRNFQKKEVEIKELGGSVFITEIPVKKRAELLSKLYSIDENGKPKISTDTVIDGQLEIVAACVVDESGKPIFTLEELKGVSSSLAPVIDKLFAEADKLNGITGAGEKDIAKK